MKLPSTAAGTARWSWIATMLLVPFVQVPVWLALRPASGSEPPDYTTLLPGQAVISVIFGIIAAMLGILLWPLTRRVIAKTSGRQWWNVVLRSLYAGTIGGACGLFIAYHLPILLPGRVPFLSLPENLGAIVPPIVTALMWAAWYMFIEDMARSRPSKPG